MKSKRLEISNFPDDIRKRLNNRLENKKSCGREKGDLRKAVIGAVKQWLDNQDELEQLKRLQAQGHYKEEEE